MTLGCSIITFFNDYASARVQICYFYTICFRFRVRLNRVNNFPSATARDQSLFVAGIGLEIYRLGSNNVWPYVGFKQFYAEKILKIRWGQRFGSSQMTGP